MSWIYFASTCLLARFLKVFLSNGWKVMLRILVQFSFPFKHSEIRPPFLHSGALLPIDVDTNTPIAFGYLPSIRYIRWLVFRNQPDIMWAGPIIAYDCITCVRIIHIYIVWCTYTYDDCTCIHCLHIHSCQHMTEMSGNVRKGSAACFRYVWPIKIPGLPLMSSWSEHRRETNRPFQLDAGGARCAAWTRRSESLEE